MRIFVSFIASVALIVSMACDTTPERAADHVADKPYLLDTPVETVSFSAENPTGARGAGGQEASRLGVGRKGRPRIHVAPGDTAEIADISGPGTIRHIWMAGSTMRDFDKSTGHVALRSSVIRIYWDGQSHPSIECPLGDFFGVAHAKVVPFQSAVHSVSEFGGVNIWLPMPFARQARITLSNEADADLRIYYQIDCTRNDPLPDHFGRLHACFRRENPTTEGKDFEILPKRQGEGRFMGAVIGVRPLAPNWWGEGEVKFYLDGDTEFPTLCGTGSEDYICLAFGVQQTPFLYHGASLAGDEFVTAYRWHLPDPIYWKKDIRVTMQQIGYEPGTGLVERSDDWCAVPFWYEPIPSDPLPPLPALKERIADIAPFEAKW